MSATDRPVCECHGEPCRKNTDGRYTDGFYWRCAVRDRIQSHVYRSERQPFLSRGRKLLADRRYQALRRRRERHERNLA